PSEARILSRRWTCVDSILRQQRRKEVQGVERIRSTPADLSEMKQARRVARELPIETLDILIFTRLH
ncbi:MAG TPA: hypothetical protein VJ255_04870, partial [Candidatus Acidoferrum sp.]|nr:hypothetical protein [Candidatus Acidoferrum sp.]